MKILCPIDFSKAANNAVEYAARFAQATKAELSLVHVRLTPTLQDIANVNAGLTDEEPSQDKELFGTLESHAQNVRNTFGISCEAVMISQKGTVEKTLGSYLDQSIYDLIIMGTNGAEHVNQLYFGTHTYNVIRKTHVPVLMIPQGCNFEELDHLVYATNYQQCDASVIKKVLHLTRAFKPSIDVFHISKKDTEMSKEVFHCVKGVMEDSLSETRVRFYRNHAKDAASGINDFIKTGKRNLLVLLTDDYSVLKRIFRDSVTRELSFIAIYPVLVFNRKAVQDFQPEQSKEEYL